VVDYCFWFVQLHRASPSSHGLAVAAVDKLHKQFLKREEQLSLLEGSGGASPELKRGPLTELELCHM
jgi:hypothetical protein